MASLSFIHILYIILIVAFLILMALKKSIVLPCAFGILLIGLFITGSVTGAMQALFNSMVWAGSEFLGIIIAISLIVAMSKALTSIGADVLMVKPFTRYMRSRNLALLFVGIVMFAISIFLWPSPAVALVGALLLPLVARMGIPIIWAAVTMNLFGHGMALSGDFFLQGAPTITAKAAGSQPFLIMSQSIIPWAVTAVVTIIVALFMYKRDVRNLPSLEKTETAKSNIKPRGAAVAAAIITPAVFIADIVLMLTLKLQGGDATALVGGSAMLLLAIITCADKGINAALENATDYLKDGFRFGISIFAPVIVIGAFFFLGGEGAAKTVFGENSSGILNDIGMHLANGASLSKVPIVLSQTALGIVTGLDGSGFSGLPLVGATAATFSQAVPLNRDMLAALGQIVTIWVGGGTLIPWAVIPVAAICNVSPLELVRKNLIPVACGISAAVIVTCILV